MDSRTLAPEGLGTDADEGQWVHLAEKNLREKTAERRKEQTRTSGEHINVVHTGLQLIL